ncbi:Eco57I restriction-modification methylase domain-containing protein [Streptomyces cinerochromogenes]|uniref:Eco57I restriction-modification methylase domain-containing protein n=1 Tax=Streptomyces cinerochromogenes TaxID=66422 RepID=UPI0019BFDD3E|nr:Eco57I restriction-modification methylase domain-containing protein [Streptomyces cinerochromogenes]GGS82828.1 type II DNA modification methyltransferase [Streptomyces cinerochromogenes]
MTHSTAFIPDALPSIPDTAVEHGEVYTRDWVVEMILDLVGYTPDRDLAELVISDPACGSGAFLLGIVRRLSAACRKHEVELPIDGVRALDLLSRNVRASREAVVELLVNDGWARDHVEPLVEGWIRQGDYLLQEPAAADFVVGNPPYIRLEDVPDQRMKLYRQNHPTMVGRADIYVGFYERALGALTQSGALGFICADRWMRNQYGRELRRLVGHQFSVEFVAIMHDVDAFEESVAAYPAITVIRKRPQTPAVVAQTTKHFDATQAQRLVTWAASDNHAETTAGYEVSRLPSWFSGGESWPAGSPARLEMLEDLNERFPALEDTGARVGIGLATGADAVFLTQDPDQVEQSRALPMSMVRDARTGTLKWDGTYLVNPWEEDGKLVDLDRYPKLKAYFERHREALAGRYIAKKNPVQWYKTIDKVDSSLTAKPKLLLPDMKLTIHPVLDEGGHYPHHNLYYVVADAWDLRVLGGLLLSRVAQAFVEAYAVRMRGGTLRFQAQYLRRIRVPRPEAISETDAQALIRAFDRRDIDAATTAALRVYGLDHLPA